MVNLHKGLINSAPLLPNDLDSVPLYAKDGLPSVSKFIDNTEQKGPTI